ncbi:hypothetical protein [Lactobacillus helveticus]|uniref:Uncharacterized protein n=1 Tax=Lactobacillus helveticus CIRM-BIA 104 TaxID=1226333 RepID=U6FFC5_LACHE|nr:hypothetical protein [Lactobacillus helveticus]KXN77886.1 hypothetical protein AY470_01270 [Lactobacillus helveticus]MCT3424720.1 hypothetical protein [Lactobacillus helveticus]CDI61276.1 Protein of unknown function [Lactobacillus helveticus CIRM-BIA 104]
MKLLNKGNDDYNTEIVDPICLTREIDKVAYCKPNHPSRTVLLKDYFSDIPFAEVVADEHNTLPCSW